MTNRTYILDADGNPSPVSDYLQWSTWMDSVDRQIALTESGDISVSTAFLGLDHDYLRRGLPILFETMVRTPDGPGQVARYATKAEAVKGHNIIVHAIKTQQEMAEHVAIETLVGIMIDRR